MQSVGGGMPESGKGRKRRPVERWNALAGALPPEIGAVGHESIVFGEADRPGIAWLTAATERRYC
jgi:hypothetical protein